MFNLGQSIYIPPLAKNGDVKLTAHLMAVSVCKRSISLLSELERKASKDIKACLTSSLIFLTVSPFCKETEKKKLAWADEANRYTIFCHENKERK